MLLLVEITTQEDEAGVIGGGRAHGGGEYGGYHGTGRGPGTGRGGCSVWGRPTPHPTSVVCL